MYKENSYLEELKTVVPILNELLNSKHEKNINGIFNGFIGKYFHKEVKREIYDLIYSNEGVYIFQIDYYTDYVDDFNEADNTTYKTDIGNFKI